MDLIQMGFIIKYLFSHMDGVGDDDDFGNVIFAACLMLWQPLDIMSNDLTNE